MFEIMILLLGAMPFLVGLYAVRAIKKSDDNGSDDPPPPPDPQPPLPLLPPSPEPRQRRRPLRRRADRTPAAGGRVRMPAWSPRVRC